MRRLSNVGVVRTSSRGEPGVTRAILATDGTVASSTAAGRSICPWHAARSLRVARHDRQGRHGERDPRATARPRGLREDRRGQGDPSAPGAGPCGDQHAARRGSPRGADRSPERRPHVRARRGARHLLHRDGVPRGRVVRARAQEGGREGPATTATRCRRQDRCRRSRGVVGRARLDRRRRQTARHRSPRRLARQHRRALQRLGQGRRLRHREGAGPRDLDAGR